MWCSISFDCRTQSNSIHGLSSISFDFRTFDLLCRELNVVGSHFTVLFSYNLGQKLLGILYFLSHRTPIPRIWYHYGPLPSPHTDHSGSFGMRNDLSFPAAVFISSRNAPPQQKAVSETSNDPARFQQYFFMGGRGSICSC